ncbi:MAG TPA: sialidase family protein [Methylomirabilota bacterium]|nr:sialidase family protein [Methylomirabilota bacterium]
MTLAHREAFHTAFIVALLVAFSISDVTSSSVPSVVGCNNPPSLMQCGTTSCTLSPGNTAPFSCSVTINFSPPFLNAPKFTSAMWNGCQTGVCHFETFTAIPIASLTVQSDNGETWTSMPVASTEIYGTSNHETSMVMPSGVNAAYFSVLCIQGSLSATAKLRPQYSTDGGNTWNELASNTGFLDASVDASDCSFTVNGVEAITIGPSGIPATLANMNTQFRVIGFNGNGLGDTVIFNNIQIILAIQFSNTFFTCISGASTTCLDGVAPTKSSMTIVVESMNNPGAWIQGINWIAIE